MDNDLIAAIILKQLGGNKFKAMTGAKDFVYGARYLQFRISGCLNKATHVQVHLNSRDLYDLVFIRNRKFEYDTIGRVENIEGDRLQSVFSRETGLDTHL